MSTVILGLVVGCAPAPQNIKPVAQNTSLYEDLSCKSIVAQRNDVVGRVNKLSGDQAALANKDAVATGVALVLFWPAVFLIGSPQETANQLASEKGVYDALTTVGRAKGCFTE